MFPISKFVVFPFMIFLTDRKAAYFKQREVMNDDLLIFNLLKTFFKQNTMLINY